MDYKFWIQKITSRRWWGYITGMVVACLIAFNVDNDMISRIVAVIAAVANFAIYTWGEAKIDAERVKNQS